MRANIPKMDKRLDCLRKDLKQTGKNANNLPTAGLGTQTHVLTERITKPGASRYTKWRSLIKAKDHLEGELFATGYWTRVNKEKGPGDIIYTILKPNHDPKQAESSETRSEKMADIVRDYRNNLQNDNPREVESLRREIAIRKVLGAVKTRLTDE